VAVIRPTSIADACAALADHPGAIPLAGGTDLMVEVNAGRPLRGWSVDRDDGRPTVRIGATTTFRELMDDELAGLVPALAQAARTVGSPQIRNAGTIGGNLATASPAGDTLPVLTALDATVELVSADGSRSLPVTELVTGPKRTALAADEMVAAVHVPVLEGPQEFLKVGTRSAMVISVVSLAAVADVAARRIGIAAGAATARPQRATEAEELAAAACDWDGLVAGAPTPPSPEDLARFAAAVRAAVAPIDDHRSTAEYRRHAAGVLASRAIERLFGPDGAAHRGSSAA
jgi:CO/xanthine dehydrogenase FAD-binding subunit